MFFEENNMKKLLTVLFSLSIVLGCTCFAACENNGDSGYVPPDEIQNPEDKVPDEGKDEETPSVPPALPVGFESAFEKEFPTAKHSKEITLSGIAACPVERTVAGADGAQTSKAYYFVGAYSSSFSRIYVIDENGEDAGHVTLKTSDGNNFNEKISGIALNNVTLWVSSENTVYVAKSDNENSSTDFVNEIIEKAEKRGSLTLTSSFNANCTTMFLSYFDDSRYSSKTYDRLYIGGKRGESNFMYEYNVSSSSDNEYGLSVLNEEGLAAEHCVPEIQKIFTIPENVRGAAFSARRGYGTNDGTLVLAQNKENDYSDILCADWQKIISSSNSSLYTELYEESSFTTAYILQSATER